MSEAKKYLEKDVLTAARERLETVFTEFDHVYLSVSGGKDSSVMMQLAREIAADFGATFDILFVDLEAQYKATIDQMVTLIANSEHVLNEIYWVCLPLSLRNAVSQIQPKWTCWNQAERDKWVRDPPDADYVLYEDDHPFWMKRLGFSQTKGGREKLEMLREEYGDSLIDPSATDDKHLGEWAETHV